MTRTTAKAAALLKYMLPFLVFALFPSCCQALDFDDYCDSARFPSSSHYLEYDPYKCDVTIGLYCNPYVAKCTCFVTDSEYSHHYDRCMAKVGHPCKASPAFTISCVENAECEEPTGFCKCRERYVSNEYKTGCYLAGASALKQEAALIAAIVAVWGTASFAWK
jgi:hypothetical protein